MIQNTIGGASLQTSVVGIGLNVNQTEFDPALPNPTSLAASFGQALNLDTVMERLFSCLESRYLQLKNGRFGEIKAAYEGLLFRKDETTQLLKTADNATFEGVIRGVSETGHLQVELVSGGMGVFDLKEIQLLL